MTDGDEIGAGHQTPAGDRQYETKVVQAIRGTESRAAAKWRKEGWELVDQNPGTLRTEMTFRRIKPKTFGSYLAQGYTVFRGLTPRTQKVVAASVGGLALVLVTGGVVAATLGGDEGGETVTTPSQAAAPAADQSPPATGQAAAPSIEAVEPTGDATDEETVAPSATESEESSASETTADEDESGPQAVTIDNNDDLSALLELTDSCSESVAAFADEYADRTVEFDAAIGALSNHDGATTRYDILINAGEFSESVARGPWFQFRDVNMGDLNLTGDVPDTIGVGQELRVLATVNRYEESGCLLLLDPITTEVP